MRRLPAAIRVIHEDADVLVVDKPFGLLTANVPGETRPALFDFLKMHVRSSRPRVPRRDPNADPDAPRSRSAGQGVYVIHRLDKEASGLLVFATSEKAFHWLKDDFKAKRVHRIYTALVEGEWGEVGMQTTIQSFLFEPETGGRVHSISNEAFRGAGKMSGDKDQNQPKPAVTHVRVIAVGKGMSLVQVRLETGRKHQIRTHLSERGHPIVGDPRYGAQTDPLGRLGLHASELGFTHPGTGQTVRYSNAAPAGFYLAVGQKVPAGAAAAEMPSPSASTTSPMATPPHLSHAAPAAKSSANQAKAPTGTGTSWEPVVEWYDQMQGDAAEDGSDHYRELILPGTIRLVQPSAGMRVLDVGCGQGIVSRAVAALGAEVIGIDASPGLIEAAKSRGSEGGRARYGVGDAGSLEPAVKALGGAGVAADTAGPFDAATCVMALGNIEPLEPVFRGVVALLKPGGRFVAVISHPAFRAPGQTSWGFDDSAGAQYRRVDGYLSAGQHQVQMHPGLAAHGKAGGEAMTWSFHRPLQTYARLLGAAGLLIESIEEWTSRRTSQPGPRAAAENRARREIPLFMAFRCVRVER